MGFLDKVFGKKDAHDHDDAHVHEGEAGAKHDPVCDMWVDPAKAPGKSEHEGETIHFCSPGCKRAFDANPAKYMPKLKRA